MGLQNFVLDDMKTKQHYATWNKKNKNSKSQMDERKPDCNSTEKCRRTINGSERYK
jgi:hypothetical protein